MVNHIIGEYGRGTVHTNTIEGYFSILQTGHAGHLLVLRERLHRYLAEFDFRYTNRAAKASTMRSADALLAGIVGKRLTYRLSHAEA